MFGFTTAPNINAAELAWGDSVSNTSGGAIKFQLLLIPSIECFFYPCTPSYPILWFGWIPDYPAPVDNWQGAYGGTGLWGSQDALYQTLIDGTYGGEFNDTTVCGHYNPTAANMTTGP